MGAVHHWLGDHRSLRDAGALTLALALASCDTAPAGNNLFTPCTTHDDCSGSGLLCDERRGCVECVEDADCPSTDVCRVGTCELIGSTGAGGSGEQTADGSNGGAGTAGGSGNPSGNVDGGDVEGGGNGSGNGGGGTARAGNGNDGGTNSGNGGTTSRGGTGSSGGGNGGAGGSGSGGDDGEIIVTPPNCGNITKTEDEECDDGNLLPFDGCDARCQVEPSCDASGCVSACGDGLVSGEECDDGNRRDGDGCSSTCTIEGGFRCELRPPCERSDGGCIQRVSAVYRDFLHDYTDFNDNSNCSTQEGIVGMVEPTLSADGKPTLSSTLPNDSCISEPALFDDWYRDSSNSETLVGSLVLHRSDAGGFVNRYGPNGEQWIAIDPTNEMGGYGNSPAECAETCAIRNACDLQCGAEDNAAEDAQDDYDMAVLDGAPDEELATLLEAAEAAAALSVACHDDCELTVDDVIALCSADCKPCSYSPGSTQQCVGGELIYFDGNPLFFPVDDLPSSVGEPAKVPEQYGWIGWPWEEDVLGAGPDHNFAFTSELRYWFRYDASIVATLDYLGDDDCWVFINRQLVVDVGGIHVPLPGSVTIDAAFAEEHGMVDGGVYEIAVFHAERQPEGSSFQLSVPSFPSRSVCTRE